MKNWKKVLCAAVASCALISGIVCEVSAMDAEGRPHIGISWKSNTQNYEGFKKVIEDAGGIPVELPQITNVNITYNEDGTISEDCLYPTGMLKEEYADAVKDNHFDDTNVAAALEGIDGVFFTGGEDVSPSLFRVPEKEANMGEEINAARDVSDYTLMAYCIENDVPTLAVCRGEQVMGIVHGVTFIQDLPTYYAERGSDIGGLHRMLPDPEVERDYTHHDVEIFPIDSHLYDIVGDTKLERVSSWHHQAIGSLEGTDLIQTAQTVHDGIPVVEGIENPNKTFMVGIQFHPENDLVEVSQRGKDADKFCDNEICLRFFKALVAAASK